MKQSAWIAICTIVLGEILGQGSHAQTRTQANASWYYCDDSHAYYPYVQSCKIPWRQVPAVPTNQESPGTASAVPQALYCDVSRQYFPTTTICTRLWRVIPDDSWGRAAVDFCVHDRNGSGGNVCIDVQNHNPTLYQMVLNYDARKAVEKDAREREEREAEKVRSPTEFDLTEKWISDPSSYETLRNLKSFDPEPGTRAFGIMSSASKQEIPCTLNAVKGFAGLYTRAYGHQGYDGIDLWVLPNGKNIYQFASACAPIYLAALNELNVPDANRETAALLIREVDADIALLRAGMLVP